MISPSTSTDTTVKLEPPDYTYGAGTLATDLVTQKDNVWFLVLPVLLCYSFKNLCYFLLDLLPWCYMGKCLFRFYMRVMKKIVPIATSIC